jgi:ATP-binding cassette ChvD family protein
VPKADELDKSRFIVTMKDVAKFIPPDRDVLKNITISMYPGAKIGVLGANGAGKSTLLKIIAGVDDQYTGTCRVGGGFSVGYLEQEPQLDPTKDVLGNVEDAVRHIKDVLARYDEVCAAMGDPDADFDKLLAEQGKLQDEIDATGAWELDRRIEIAMDALRLPPPDADVTVLSGGEKRRVALCRLLLQQPDLLLLDEPTNHLDAESVAWLERSLQSYPGTIVAVTHDRYFLDNVAGWILEIERGRGLPFEGNYSSWLEQKQLRLAQEAKADEKRKKALATELDWIRQGTKGRQAKGKARINAYEQLAAEAGKQEIRWDGPEIVIPPGPRLGDLVLEADHLTKGYGERLLIDDLTFSLPKGGIIGVIGPNGAGKTTLFNMIAGREQPDAGELRVGPTVKLAYVDQSRASLDPDKTVYEELLGERDQLIFGGQQINGRAYCGQFGFKGSEQQKKVGVLSGGERNRLLLAKVLTAGGNLLLLDEPTNDLDVDTLRALEEGILQFAGCAVVISHDRWFLDRIATHILAFEDDSQVRWFEGGFTDYEVDRKKRLGADADQPHRPRFKPLVR